MKNIKGIIFALISSGTFGLIPLLSIPVMETGMGAPSILFYRFLFSTLMMGGICLLKKESFKISTQHLTTIFALSLLYAATALLLIFSYNYIPSGVATTIHFMYPILVSILMVIFFKEKKSIILILAAILSLFGVILLCWTGGEDVKLTGILIASLTIVTYATYIVGINQTKAGRINAEILTFYILLFGALIFLIFGATTTGLESIPNTESFVRIFLLALLCTVVSDLTLVYAIKLVGSTITSILGSTEPLVAVIVGIFYFSEKFTFSSFCGITLIVLSVILVISKGVKKGNKKEAER
ncbi:MAG: DMT family transporter [Dysgonomonas sp.]